MSVELARTLLSRTPIFEGLTRDQLDRLAARAQIRAARKGEVLFSQGDPSDSLYTLIEGTATISLLSEAGREMIFQIANPGDSFGELSLLDGLPRSATCTMRSDGRILSLSRQEFLGLLEDPRLARSIITVLCQMLRRSTDRAEFLALRPLRARVAHVLIGNGRVPRGGGPAEVRLTQQELALMCGAARPRVNQILKGFEDQGILGKDGRTILIEDADALEDVAQEMDED